MGVSGISEICMGGGGVVFNSIKDRVKTPNSNENAVFQAFSGVKLSTSLRNALWHEL